MRHDIDSFGFRDRGEALVLFEACLLLLSSTMARLNTELCRLMEDDSILEEEVTEPGVDLALGVRLAEAAAQVRLSWRGMELRQLQLSKVVREHTIQVKDAGPLCPSLGAAPTSQQAEA